MSTLLVPLELVAVMTALVAKVSVEEAEVAAVYTPTAPATGAAVEAATAATTASNAPAPVRFNAVAVALPPILKATKLLVPLLTRFTVVAALSIAVNLPAAADDVAAVPTLLKVRFWVWPTVALAIVTLPVAPTTLDTETLVSTLLVSVAGAALSSVTVVSAVPVIFAAPVP